MEVRMKNVKLSSSCCQAVIKLSSNTKIQKYKNTQNTQNTKNTKNNSPAPAINTQKMQKHKKKKHAKRATKYKILLSRQLLVLRTCNTSTSYKKLLFG